MKTFKQFNESVKGNMPNTFKAVEGIKTNKTFNTIQNMLNSGEISIPGLKKAVGDGSDLKNLKFDVLSGFLKDAGAGVEKVQTKINKMK